MCRGFIWSKNNDKAGIHYASWELLCRPKIEGGRGMFSASLRVGPLCAKFAWNFLTKLNSLLNLILKAKYGDDVWSGTVKQCCSPTWKIITMGAVFLKKVVRWEVSNGNSIKWLQDT
ncbi:Putative ribonuclease H protein [Dendrobium catenatum]|uniref:Ribonuclease H protein n=1 Tax=Dendrobium catenatum TaxID=906689 RepID=A0A2I0X3W2_9ASPA|nr:Putative ribonuclease H protein [Dendrobium catenatum]